MINNKAMKYLILTIASIFLFIPDIIKAQNAIRLFPDFQEGTILMRNKAIIKSQVNYDTTHDKLLYKEGNTVMELTNLSDIDTIYIKQHKFIVSGLGFCEVKTLQKGMLFIKWHHKAVNIGKKGAYGQATQNYVQNINTSTFNNSGIINYESSDIYEMNNYNQYSISLPNSKIKRFHDKKSFFKLFPEHAMDIKNFINENHIDFQHIEDIIKLCNFSLTF